jgi:poly(3-hydroxybutyrate) depolymerase
MTTVSPVTLRPICYQGKLLSFEQEGVTRYACLNTPRQARGQAAGKKWPLLIYLHGSRTTPDSLYVEGRTLFDLHSGYLLSGNPETRGFFILSPEGRRAAPAVSITGTGFHWDTWYRNSSENLDALAIDHFLDEVVATGLIDTDRIYVYGWSNGAYMAALYGVWRHERIAAIGQYAGANSWTQAPCPGTLPDQEVPLFLMRNLCDAAVKCSTTSSWIETLDAADWPFEYRNIGLTGSVVNANRQCAKNCSIERGIFEHIRWPDKNAFLEMLGFLREHTLQTD